MADEETPAPLTPPAPPRRKVMPDPERHYRMEGSDDLNDYPSDLKKARRLSHQGQNVEHVADSADGVWIYRVM